MFKENMLVKCIANNENEDIEIGKHFKVIGVGTYSLSLFSIDNNKDKLFGSRSNFEPVKLKPRQWQPNDQCILLVNNDKLGKICSIINIVNNRLLILDGVESYWDINNNEIGQIWSWHKFDRFTSYQYILTNGDVFVYNKVDLTNFGVKMPNQKNSNKFDTLSNAERASNSNIFKVGDCVCLVQNPDGSPSNGATCPNSLKLLAIGDIVMVSGLHRETIQYATYGGSRNSLSIHDIALVKKRCVCSKFELQIFGCQCGCIVG